MMRPRLLCWLWAVLVVILPCTANYDAKKIILSGIGDRSRYGNEALLGLDGTGQAVAVADTGLDFDSCHLWQQPFPFPCFDSTKFLDTPDCSASAFASVLALGPFSNFVRMMETTEVDVVLFGAGGVGSVLPPLDLVYPDRAQRIGLGYEWNTGNDTEIYVLLDVWNEVRPQLLDVLQDSSLCPGCGGHVDFDNGTTVFVPNSNPFFFQKSDTTTATAEEKIGQPWRVLQNLLFEKCFCFFTEELEATLDPFETWKGLVPPLRILQEFAVSQTAAIARKSAGLPALDYSLLDQMCSIARGDGVDGDRTRDADGVATDMCQTMEIEWGAQVITWNICDMSWDARLIESAIGKCFGAKYLQKSTLTNRERAQASAYERAVHYTYDSTLAWWAEYTKVPPVNQVDRSRRVVHAYFTYDGCEACDGCRRLRLDSRRYSQLHTSHQMPAHLEPTDMLSLHLEPEEGDWRLDPFEARYTPMDMEVQVTVEMRMRDPRNLETVYLCLNTNQSIARVLEMAPKHLSAWTDCLTVADLESQGPAAFAMSQIPNTDLVVFELKGKIDPLPPSDAGWRVMLLNNETEPAHVSVVLQLYTKEVQCSDRDDDPAQLNDRTHSLALPSRQVASAATGQVCEAEGVTYCDNSLDSGRQLDLCRVCGGQCFAPHCSVETCDLNSTLVSTIRYLGEFPSGYVTKVFRFDVQSSPGGACPSPSGGNIICEGVDCDVFDQCLGRAETYKVHTQYATADAGSELRFGEGLLLEQRALDRLVLLTVTSFRRPDQALRSTRADFSSFEGGAEVRYVPLMEVSHNLSIAQVSLHRLEVAGNESDLLDVLQNLSFSIPIDAGETIDTRQILLRFQLTILRPDGSRGIYPDGIREAGGRVNAPECFAGFSGRDCDTLSNPTDIIVTVEPQRKGRRVVSEPPGRGGRRLTANRGGHGTHIATSIVGKADSRDTPGLDARDREELRRHDGIAPGALLAFVDIGARNGRYVTPPTSIGEALMGRAYRELGARVFLNPWTCADMLWWRRQGKDFDSGQRVASERELNQMASICNRYTEHAFQVDEFVDQHPDMLVIFPAGDGGEEGRSTVAAPGTCKNCLTVGMSQKWPDALQSAAEASLVPCRPSDCPQNVDQTGACGGASTTPPAQQASCCTSKYAQGQYDADLVEPRSGRGPAVSEQGEWSVISGDLYGDLAPLRFRRFKPELLAPGLNIVSGRSDGDPTSRGTQGCRCCVKPPSGGGDQRCLSTMSGSAQAAALAAGAALIVRQWFEGGYYPAGVGSNLLRGHSPSAALVRAMLVASAEPMRGIPEGWGVRDFTTVPKSAASDEGGYGTIRLDSVLHIAADAPPARVALEPQVEAEGLDCECYNNNTLLMHTVPGAMERFGDDYGTSCRAWHAAPGPQSCGALYFENPGQRPAPPGALSTELDRSCCMSWCFVRPECPSAQPWSFVPGMFFSFKACADDVAAVESCSWQRRQVYTVARDHTLLTRPPGKDEFVTFAPDTNPEAGAITQGEKVTYTVFIHGTSTFHPLSVAMTYTDPPPPLGSKTILVNDLDLVVVVIPLQVVGGPASNISLDQLPLDRTRLRRINGNEVLGGGGDRDNNVEKVRVDDMKGPAMVEVSVAAHRVVRGSFGSENGELCQTFALVIAGQLDGQLSVGAINVSVSPAAQPGVCGRAPVPPEPEDPLFKTVEVVGIVIGCSLGALCVVSAIVCSVRYRAIAAFLAIEDKTSPEKRGYVSKVEKATELRGKAKSGGPDWIVLGGEASVMDEAYTGLPIMLLSGPGKGEHATITEYDGKTKTAVARFGHGPVAGTEYAIAHVGVDATGYHVGDAGYIPMTELPPAKEPEGVYAKQLSALKGVRYKVGKLAAAGLTAMGVGRQPVPRTTRQHIEAVRAGLNTGKPLHAGDLFIAQFDQTEEEKARAELELQEGNLTPRTRAARQHFVDGVHARNAARAQFGESEEGLKGRNYGGKIEGTNRIAAPPLKHKAIPTGPRGFIKTALRRSGFPPEDDGVGAVTWELESPQAMVSEPSRAHQPSTDEPTSPGSRAWGAGGVLVTASLEPGPVERGGKKGKLTAADKAKLIDNAFR